MELKLLVVVLSFGGSVDKQLLGILGKTEGGNLGRSIPPLTFTNSALGGQCSLQTRVCCVTTKFALGMTLFHNFSSSYCFGKL